jgi:hypothetical protein
MPAGPVGRRRPLKGPVTPPQRLFSALDKDELKEKCLQRVKAERARLIAKLRRERMGMVSAAHSESCSNVDLSLEARSILAAGLRQHSSRATTVEKIEFVDVTAEAAAADVRTESMHECAAEEEAAYRHLHNSAIDGSRGDAMQTDAQQQQQQQQQKTEQLYDDDADSTRQMLSLDEYEDMMCFIEQVRRDHRTSNEHF